MNADKTREHVTDGLRFLEATEGASLPQDAFQEVVDVATRALLGAHIEPRTPIERATDAAHRTAVAGLRQFFDETVMVEFLERVYQVAEDAYRAGYADGHQAAIADVSGAER